MQRNALRKTTEMLNNTKYKVNIHIYSLDISNVESGEREGERKNIKKLRVQRGRERRIASS